MKSRPRSRDTAKADALVNQVGDDPEVATKTDSQVESVQKKPVKKLGKSHPENTDYHKMMLYVQSDIRAELAERAFKSPNMDMSDIVNQLLADKLGMDFIEADS